MQFPVLIGLHRSTLLVFLLVLVHIVAVACLVALPWPFILRLAALALLGISLRHALRPPKIVGLRLSARGQLDCLLVDGGRVPAKVLPNSTVFFQLIVVRLQVGEEKRASSLMLLPDQMSVEQFRLLRLWLRWQAGPTEGDGSVS